MRFLILLLMTSMAWAVSRHVPSEYPTIQSALDAVEDSDTVLVAVGVYAEALIAPQHDFTLKGDVAQDTGDYPRPVVDPTSLPGSQSLGCLILGSANYSIEDIRFVNGAAMYPYAGLGGGVRATATSPILRRCVFDSTAGGILAGSAGTCTLENCRFLDIQGSCVYSDGIALLATDCEFHGRALFNIHVGSGSHFLRCQFLGNPSGSLCYASGRGLSFEGCVFGPSLPGETSFDPALMLAQPEGEIRGNLFTGLSLGSGAIHVQCACNDTDEIKIHGNMFVHDTVATAQGNAGVSLFGIDNPTGRCNAVIDSNYFVENGGNVVICRAAYLRVDARVEQNHFVQLSALHTFPPTAAVAAMHSIGTDLYTNRFDQTGLAVYQGDADTLEAMHNWWGDPTGPYSQAQNPLGQGDTIIGNQISIIPWCTDTNCTATEAAYRHRATYPSTYSLSIYPNPFNRTSIIHLEVPQAEIVRVELFDMLGRRVKELWSGIVADRKEIAVDGSALASGVYFVRVTNTIWNRPLVSAKIVLLK
jgi:hypothetical protein